MKPELDARLREDTIEIGRLPLCAVRLSLDARYPWIVLVPETLGNMVPQLHVHVVARFEGDDAWPGAIWGAHPPLEYTREQRAERVTLLQNAFASIEHFEAAG